MLSKCRKAASVEGPNTGRYCGPHSWYTESTLQIIKCMIYNGLFYNPQSPAFEDKYLQTVVGKRTANPC